MNPFEPGRQQMDAGTRQDLLAALQALGAGPVPVYAPGDPAHTPELYAHMPGSGCAPDPVWKAHRAAHLAALPAPLRRRHRRVLSPVARLLGVDWKALLAGMVAGDVAVVTVIQPVLEHVGRVPGDTFLQLAGMACVTWFVSKTVEGCLRRNRWVQARSLGVAALPADPARHLG